MSLRKWRETKRQPSSAGLGHQIICCLVSLHFLCDILHTGLVDRMLHRKWRETKQQPGRTRSGHQISHCLVSLHFLCDILSGRPVDAVGPGHILSPEYSKDLFHSHFPTKLREGGSEGGRGGLQSNLKRACDGLMMSAATQ